MRGGSFAFHSCLYYWESFSVNWDHIELEIANCNKQILLLSVNTIDDKPIIGQLIRKVFSHITIPHTKQWATKVNHTPSNK